VRQWWRFAALAAFALAELGTVMMITGEVSDRTLAGESHDSALELVRLAICGATLATVSAIDIAEQRVPNRLVLPATLACACLSLISGVSASVLLAGAALVLILAVVSFARPHALGMGDVKLALLVVVGLDGSATQALLFGVLLATIAGLATIAHYGASARRSSLPLAPFIAVGLLLALLT
jgi:leader peptidase (prepilin peptidase)/N-methyltransferase